MIITITDRQSPHKRISTFLLTGNDSKSATKVFTLLVIPMQKGML